MVSGREPTMTAPITVTPHESPARIVLNAEDWDNQILLYDLDEADRIGRELLFAVHLLRSRKNLAASALGRKGGMARSARKTAAVRRNGRLGGRPKKTR